MGFFWKKRANQRKISGTVQFAGNNDQNEPSLEMQAASNSGIFALAGLAPRFHWRRGRFAPRYSPRQAPRLPPSRSDTKPGCAPVIWPDTWPDRPVAEFP